MLILSCKGSGLSKLAVKVVAGRWLGLTTDPCNCHNSLKQTFYDISHTFQPPHAHMWLISDPGPDNRAREHGTRSLAVSFDVSNGATVEACRRATACV